MALRSSGLEDHIEWMKSHDLDTRLLLEQRPWMNPDGSIRHGVDYLVEAIGIEKEEIRKDVALLEPDALKAAVDYLKLELRFSNRAIKRYQEILTRTREDIQLTVGYLKKLGFGNRAIKSCPEILAKAPEDLKPTEEYIKKNLDFSNNEIKSCPEILTRTPEDLEPAVGYLKKLGFENDAIRECPRVLTRTYEGLRSTAEYLKKELGFENDTIRECPELLTTFHGKMRMKAKHLLEKWGFSKEEIKESPRMLEKSLEYCIKPRLAFLNHRGIEIFSPEVKDIMDADEVFCERYKAEVKEYRSFRTLYRRTRSGTYLQSHLQNKNNPAFKKTIKEAAILRERLKKASPLVIETYASSEPAQGNFFSR